MLAGIALISMMAAAAVDVGGLAPGAVAAAVGVLALFNGAGRVLWAAVAQRLGRLAVETVTDAIPGYQFELGKGVTLREGTDVSIIATGMNERSKGPAITGLILCGIAVFIGAFRLLIGGGLI